MDNEKLSHYRPTDCTRFFYADVTTPAGPLPMDWRAQACWRFYTLAQKVKERVGNSIEDQLILDDQPWQDKPYANIARSVAMMYGLESPSEFEKFWEYVDAACVQYGYPRPDSEYMHGGPLNNRKH